MYSAVQASQAHVRCSVIEGRVYGVSAEDGEELGVGGGADLVAYWDGEGVAVGLRTVALGEFRWDGFRFGVPLVVAQSDSQTTQNSIGP